MGSDGQRDNQPAQTNQANDQAADAILGNKSFAPMQSQLVANGSPSAQRNQLVDFTTKAFKPSVPLTTQKLASPPAVAFNIQNKLGLKAGLPKPKI